MCNKIQAAARDKNNVALGFIKLNTPALKSDQRICVKDCDNLNVLWLGFESFVLSIIFC